MRRMTMLVLLAAGLPATADEVTGLARVLDERTVAVLRVDLATVALDKAIPRLAKQAKPPALSKASRELVDRVEALRAAGVREAYLVVSLADVPDDPPFLVVPLGDKADAARVTKELAVVKLVDPTLGTGRVGSALLVASPAVLKRVQAMTPVPRPEILDGLGKDAPAGRLVVAPTTDARRILEEVLPTLPEQLGGGPITALTKGWRYLTLDADPAAGTARLTVHGKDADAARDLEALLGRLVGKLAESKELRALVPRAKELAGLWKPTRDGSRLTVALDEAATADLLKPYLDPLLFTDDQARSRAQVRRLLAAMIEHERRQGAFPAQASYDRAGKPLLSWRVHLLPLLGQDALYKEFKLDEPWDSAHNQPLVKKLPAVYRPDDAKLAGQGRTRFVGPVGENLMFPGKRGVRVAEVNDGLEWTVLIAEADDAHAVEWTRPADLKPDEKEPAKGLSARHADQYLFGLADGKPRFVPRAVPAFSLWGLFTRNQGEVLDVGW